MKSLFVWMQIGDAASSANSVSTTNSSEYAVANRQQQRPHPVTHCANVGDMRSISYLSRGATTYKSPTFQRGDIRPRKQRVAERRHNNIPNRCAPDERLNLTLWPNPRWRRSDLPASMGENLPASKAMGTSKNHP